MFRFSILLGLNGSQCFRQITLLKIDLTLQQMPLTDLYVYTNNCFLLNGPYTLFTSTSLVPIYK